MQTLKISLSAALACGLCLSSVALATNGYSPTGFGTINKGMAGAGVALPQDGMAIATNPAAGVHLGHRTDVGAALFSPKKRGYVADELTPTGSEPIVPGSYSSDNNLFLVPHFAWNKPLDDDSAITVALGANGGMNTDYDVEVWERFDASATAPTGVDFSQLFLGVSYSRKLNERHSVGIMPIVAVQRFKAEGLEPFAGMSIDGAHVTNNGYDYSWGGGVRIGWLGQINERLSLAASAQSRLYMSNFDDYRGLFAEQGDFDVPPTAVIGFAYQLTPAVTLVGDWQRIWFSEVKALGNPNDQPIAGPDNLLGADQGLGFGWDDIDILKLGVQWQYSPALTLRGGISHASQLFEGGNALFNILAPATPQTHLSVGLTHASGPHQISLAYTHALKNKIGGSNPLTGTQTGYVHMAQNELEVSWGYSF